MTSALRPYQAEFLDLYTRSVCKRFLMAWTMGSGKSITALSAFARLGLRRYLIICPANARGVWQRERERWFNMPIAPINHLYNTVPPTEAARAAHAAAKDADVQAVSYHLMPDLLQHSAVPFEGIIADECHRLAMPTSKQSKALRAYLEARPKLPLLMLSGTPAPTEAKQMHHQYHLLQPNIFGKLYNGTTPWAFLREYCEQEEIELPNGEKVTRFFGGKNLQKLAAKTSHLTHRVTEAVLAQYLPPVRTSVLYQDRVRSPKDIAQEWLEGLDDGPSHVALVAYHHKVADKLQVAAEKLGWPTVRVGGELPPVRDSLLRSAQSQPRCALVATARSIAEAIDLSFVRRALIFETEASPGHAAQLLRRFGRTGSLPTTIEYVAQLADADRLELLHSRLSQLADLLTPDAASQTLSSTFAARELTPDRMSDLIAAMFSETRGSLTESQYENGE